MAIRLLSSFQATVERLNLHPDLKKLVKNTHGLILVSGPTGSGKSSTLAALIQEINLTETRHIVTVESPIEYTFRPRRSYIRQREVGRDTPSFEQALLDALREDPDVLMVGEMRDPETMRLTLSASETGHLVLATVHSSSCAEALQRVASAFPAEIQGAVCAQLADCLVAVISQRLRFRPDLNIRVPECEILVATHAVKNFIRNARVFQNHLRHRNRRRSRHVEFSTVLQMAGDPDQFVCSRPGCGAAGQRTGRCDVCGRAAAVRPRHAQDGKEKQDCDAGSGRARKASGLKSNRSKASLGRFSSGRSKMNRIMPLNKKDSPDSSRTVCRKVSGDRMSSAGLGALASRRRVSRRSLSPPTRRRDGSAPRMTTDKRRLFDCLSKT